jgi:hypothetical protein
MLTASTDPEAGQEASEMLTDNAKNLMGAVSEVLFATLMGSFPEFACPCIVTMPTTVAQLALLCTCKEKTAKIGLKFCHSLTRLDPDSVCRS